MKPTAIQVAADIYMRFNSAQTLCDKDPTQATFTLDDVIYLLNKYGIPTPDFHAWATALTDKKISGGTKKKLKLSNKIRAAMAEKNITLTKIAELTGKDKSHISRSLSATNITLETIIMFENILDIKILDLE